MVNDSAQKNTLAAYDAIAPLYADYSQKYQNYLNSVDALVIKHLSPNMRLLDIGSGDGRRLKKICDALSLQDVVSVEPSKEMAAICQKTTGFTVHKICGDELNSLNEDNFDAITVLWNVFGHMKDTSARLKTLKAVANKLKPNGIMIFDVNNRHNQLAYGRFNVLKRRILDGICFDEKRGDAHYEWEISGQKFPASGHLFIPKEVDKIIQIAGLKIVEKCSINYATGKISPSQLNGQLFYVVMKKYKNN